MKIALRLVLALICFLYLTGCSSKEKDPAPAAFVFTASVNGKASQPLKNAYVTGASFGVAGRVELFGYLPDGRSLNVIYGSDNLQSGTDTELPLIELASSMIPTDGARHAASNVQGQARLDLTTHQAAGEFAGILIDGSTITGIFAKVEAK